MNGLSELRQNLLAKFATEKLQVLKHVSDYSQHIMMVPMHEQYHRVNGHLQECRSAIQAQYGNSGVQLIHQLVMLDLMDKTFERTDNLHIPNSIEETLRKEFERIESTIGHPESYEFDWTSDLFAKDISICARRLLPIGPGLLEVRGLPRNLLWRSGPRQSFEFCYLWLFRLRALRPLLEIHTHLANISLFNQEGWRKAYCLIADILKFNPSILGIFRGSWFIDPTISEISPHLSYLREEPLAHGAMVFFNRIEDAGCGAFARSNRRRILFEEGKYVPKSYFMVWPRADLIRYVDTLNRIPTAVT